MKQLKPCISRTGISLCAVLAVVCACQIAAAQEQVGPDIPIGRIPGTTMMRDEFRARAYAQLSAIALNAHAYFVVHGEYPANYGALRGSDAWVIDPQNLFTPRPVQSLDFTPTSKDMTNDPSLEIYEAFAQSPHLPADANKTGSVDEFMSGLPSALGEALAKQSTVSLARVSPARITDRTPGDVLYYAVNGLLQLVMFAPDGTFIEHISEVPRQAWISRIAISSDSKLYPNGVYATSLLYYVNDLLPQYYSLVKFMCDQDAPALGKLSELGPAERIELAQELGFELRNYTSYLPIEISAKSVPGAFVDPAAGVQGLYLWMPDGTMANLAALQALVAAPVEAKPAAAKPAARKPGVKKPGAPPMGGRRQ